MLAVIPPENIQTLLSSHFRNPIPHFLFINYFSFTTQAHIFLNSKIVAYPQNQIALQT